MNRYLLLLSGLHIGLSGFSTSTIHDDDTPFAKFHKSRATRSRPPPPSGKTPIYDFDEWAKNHYGNLFRKNQENRKRATAYKKQVEEDNITIQIDRLFFGLFFILICSMLFTKTNYDDVIFGKKPSN